MKPLICVVAVLLITYAARAERPPQSREKADLVVTGKVTKLTAKDADFGGGVMTTYTATMKVDKVEKGEAKAGDTITVTWFHVTKEPRKGFVGAFGQDHKLKEKDTATFWLMKGKDSWSVIYNSNGVEKAKE